MISVLLPYRNAEATVGEALASVARELEPGDEIVAIDDGSTDRSVEVVRSCRSPRGVAIVHEATAGAGIVAALARGVARARGDLLARMDADDVSLEGRLAATRTRFAEDPSLGAVAVRVEIFSTNPRAEKPGMQRYVAWQNGLLTPEDHARAIYVESPICHPATTIRRAALVAVGGYRETSWAEDYDLWLRLVASGFGIAKVPEALFRWRMDDGSLTWNDARYAPAALLAARASYLARDRRLKTVQSYGIWGAGDTGKRLARALERERTRPSFFVDIDPKKIGSVARGAPIVGPEDGIARAANGELLVVAVGAEGARDVVRARLARAGLVEGTSFVCAA